MLSMITASWQLSKAFSKGRNEFKEGFRLLDNFLILCFLLLPLQVLLKPGKLPPLDLFDHLVCLIHVICPLVQLGEKFQIIENSPNVTFGLLDRECVTEHFPEKTPPFLGIAVCTNWWRGPSWPNWF